MKTQQSNAKQRRNAMLRAIALVIIVMLFTGFSVSLVPMAKNQNESMSENDCNYYRKEYQMLESQNDFLVSRLTQMESIYAEAMKLDVQYESTKGSNAKAALEDKIIPLEAKLRNLNIEMTSDTFTLNLKIADIYSNLLTARGAIWDLRKNTWPVPIDPGNDTGKDIARIQQQLEMQAKLRGIAKDLDDKAKEIQVATNKIRKIFGKRNIALQKELSGYVNDLKILASEIRQL